MPRTKHEKHFVVVCVFGFDRFVHCDVAVDVFLVPQAVYEHHGDFEWLLREYLVDRLVLPVSIVIRMLEDLAPEANLFESTAAAEFAGGNGFHKHVVIVGVTGPPKDLVAARCFLIVDVAHALLPKGAEMKPVVAHPAIDHRIHRHGNLQCRMRIDQRHQRQKAVVGDSENTDAPIALRDIFHEPVDGVVSVSGVIDLRRVLWSNKRPVHYVVALGTVLAANVLDHADVPAFDDHVRCVVIAAQDRAEIGAVVVTGKPVCIVRRTRHEHRRVSGALRHEDDCVEFHAVAHRYHGDAPLVVETVVRRFEF